MEVESGLQQNVTEEAMVDVRKRDEGMTNVPRLGHVSHGYALREQITAPANECMLT